ncbi:hypothetical protein [uncultured Rikenella sp.]|uniref:hypothetical protein n=1 Tax=uncultured Rikenella sp. TaxID=368003 RepID=UPI0025F7D2F4|nr:hypothetical protein [uncultured Rikenella sp.]
MLSEYCYTHLEADLAQWQAEKDPSLLSRLFCVFAAPHAAQTDVLKHRVATVLAEYLDDISYERMIRTSIQMRQSTSMEWSIDWTPYRIEDFLTESMSDEERRAVVIFASFHCCGYVRQRAVRALPDYPNTLPFIALRMADWVIPQIRREAKQAFARRLPQTTDQELLDTLPVIEQVKYCGNPQAYIAMLAPRLAGNTALFERILGNPDIRIRRFGIPNIREFLPETSGTVLIGHLTREPDPFLRQLILKSVVDSGQDLRPYYDLLLRDKYPRNRGIALSSLHDTDPEASLTTARAMLLDRNSYVRNIAKWIIRQHDSTFDLYDFYRTRIEEHPKVCIIEIAEIGKRREDVARIESFLDPTHPAICRAAMKALMQLDAPHYIQKIQEMLASPRFSIARMAFKLLHHYPRTVRV